MTTRSLSVAAWTEATARSRWSVGADHPEQLSVGSSSVLPTIGCDGVRSSSDMLWRRVKRRNVSWSARRGRGTV